MSNFKQAAKEDLQITTSRGVLRPHQLYHLPIAELDALAVSLEEIHKESGKKSFVVKKSVKDKTAKLRFDIVLEVLTDKVEEADAAQDSQAIKEHNGKIDARIAAAKDKELDGLSVAELEKLRK